MTVTEYANQAGDIFVLSDSFIRIKELIDDESSTIDDISDVIIIDPALTGTILKLANSAFFNYPGKIDTVSKAVLVLGITEVYNLVITYFTAQAFKALSIEQDYLDYLDYFWGKSVDCALLIKFLGCRLNIPNGERLFILGMLHNLGELIVKQISPDKIIESKNSKNVDNSFLPWDIQRNVLGFTYGECAAELLKRIVAPIRNQDEDNFELINTETQLLYIAKRIMIYQKSSQFNDQGELVEQLQLSSLGISDDILRMASDYCDSERLSILSVLNPTSINIY